MFCRRTDEVVEIFGSGWEGRAKHFVGDIFVSEEEWKHDGHNSVEDEKSSQRDGVG